MSKLLRVVAVVALCFIGAEEAHAITINPGHVAANSMAARRRRKEKRACEARGGYIDHEPGFFGRRICVLPNGRVILARDLRYE
jgi:hypothetical protein